jgi:hypothetical protein
VTHRFQSSNRSDYTQGAGPRSNAWPGGNTIDVRAANLGAYADSEGYIDVQTLTCAQPAGTWQEEAELLTT